MSGDWTPRAPRLVLAILVSVVTFFAATVRPVTPTSDSGTWTQSAHEGDAPVALEGGAQQCRLPGLRTTRDGRGPGTRDLDLALHALHPVGADRLAHELLDQGLTPDGARELANARRVRKHLEVMVLLI